MSRQAGCRRSNPCRCTAGRLPEPSGRGDCATKATARALMILSCMSGWQVPSGVRLLPRALQVSPTRPCAGCSSARSSTSRASIAGRRTINSRTPSSLGADRMISRPASSSAFVRWRTTSVLLRNENVGTFANPGSPRQPKRVVFSPRVVWSEGPQVRLNQASPTMLRGAGRVKCQGAGGVIGCFPSVRILPGRRSCQCA